MSKRIYSWIAFRNCWPLFAAIANFGGEPKSVILIQVISIAAWKFVRIAPSFPLCCGEYNMLWIHGIAASSLFRVKQMWHTIPSPIFGEKNIFIGEISMNNFEFTSTRLANVSQKKKKQRWETASIAARLASNAPIKILHSTNSIMKQWNVR